MTISLLLFRVGLTSCLGGGYATFESPGEWPGQPFSLHYPRDWLKQVYEDHGIPTVVFLGPYNPAGTSRAILMVRLQPTVEMGESYRALDELVEQLDKAAGSVLAPRLLSKEKTTLGVNA